MKGLINDPSRDLSFFDVLDWTRDRVPPLHAAINERVDKERLARFVPAPLHPQGRKTS